MKYSEIKTIRAFCATLHSNPDWREVASNIDAGEYDFEVDHVRFINTDDIDRIQQDELESDLYVLGCFNANFLSGIIGINSDAIEAIQKAGAYEALGKMIVSMDKIEELQSEYASADGYGHHFNRYDFSEDELSVAGELFHVFDNR